jgi:alginate O-acetyltransferase complex protein AlgI
MLFNSWEFAIFLVAVFTAYHVLSFRAQNALLILASYFFYGWWDWRFLSLLWISTLVDFHVARRMPSTEGGRRKILLLASLCTNFGLLGFFKYFNFFINSTAEALQALGFNPNMPALAVVLPVGISFYTFQTMAYTIDVYRGRIRPTNDFLVFSLYVAYFPQLVAGPIERAQHLLPQFSAPRRVTGDGLASGLVLVLIGLVRKVVIADGVASEVDSVFADPTAHGGVMIAWGTMLFAIQIYCDFAGYSDIARGVSRMFGVELMRNFEHPYFSTNITEFWRRWHISLSTWLRDYLYIPLGGNRGPGWFVYRNLMITMLLGGLWHGAAWTFVAWGGLHGLALAVHKLWLRGRKPPERAVVDSIGEAGRALTGWCLTMLIVGSAWIFFRAQSFGDAFAAIERIVSIAPGVLPNTEQLAHTLRVLLILLAIDLPQYVSRRHTVLLRLPWPARAAAYVAIIMILVVFRSGDNVQFIYFQF